jgi:Flp pilus assembly protein TadG
MISENKRRDVRNRQRQNRQNRRGAMTVFLLCVLVVLLIMAAFAVEVARMHLHRTELRICTDAAANAATKELMVGQDVDLAIAKAREIAELNPVAGKPLLLADTDIKIGRSTLGNGSFEFTETGTQPNSIRILGRRTADSPSGAIPLFFGNLVGKGTFDPIFESTATQVDREIMLVLDISGSMAWSVNETAHANPLPESAPADWEYGDAAPPASRWIAVANAVYQFCSSLQQTSQAERISLVTFNGSAYVEQGLTSNYGDMLLKIDAHSQSFNTGSTNIAAGISQGKTTLVAQSDRPFAEKTMIVLTDGMSTTGDPVAQAQQALSAGVFVHTITFSAEADQTAMADTATAGGGRHYHASDNAALLQIFREIALTTPTLLTE